ncbi:iron complex transport system ATP-binding protein [Nocardioides marinisabuli]|uniref:Iron complex transport system ATP-binding protein n=1 Tax=Nocardioides marinisabuli TaxID=419476 RepID=A0A7Y9F0F9_9ACTN|nr:ATP-binding cassette domain-containing protein [Nocardioides marinisabuli]NYD57358.1 iron complex transport system ATP-binding protein [Nocardioides marinisabuli]
MITVRSLTKQYDDAAVVDDVTLDLATAGVTALIGPNGAGKSTLLSVVARLLRPERGTAHVDDLDVHRAGSRELATRLAVLRQEHDLAARLTVRDLVSFGRFPHSRGRPTTEDVAVVDDVLARLDLTGLAHRFLDQLSGGQRQRAFIAMTLAQQTEYLLLDEPLNNLDLTHAVAIMRMLRTAADTLGARVVVVLHDINFASRWSDEIIAMAGGRVVAQGPPTEVVTPEVLRGLYGVDVHVETVRGHRVAVHYG